MEREPASKTAKTSQQQAKSSPEQKVAPAQRPSVNVLLQLQSAAGNQAVQRLLRSGVIQTNSSPEQKVAPAQQLFANVLLQLQPVVGNQAVQRLLRSGAIQATLEVSQPGDPYEQEADRVAEQVMRMTDTDVQQSGIQTNCARCDEKEEQDVQRKEVQAAPFGRTGEAERSSIDPQLRYLPPYRGQSSAYKPAPAPPSRLLRSLDAIGEVLQLKEDEEEKGKEVSEISMKSFGGGTNEASEDIESTLGRSKGGGSSLPDDTRSFMEQSIGADFSQVKVHNDSNAVQMSKDLEAHAFTHGSDIYFNSGKYNPYSSDGKHLLAHELTHVVQQNNGLQRRLFQRAPVEEPQKYYIIDYKKAEAENLKSWYDQYKFFRPAAKDQRRAPVQRWAGWPRQPPKPPVDDYAGWAHPDFGRHHDLKNHNIHQYNRQHEFAAMQAIEVTTIDLINLAIDREKVGLGQLDRIRRNDIWPNWGTLNNALTAGGVVVSCLEGACIVGLIMGAIDLYDNDTGAALEVAKDCLPKPKPNCARALTLGAASVASDRLDKSATTKRLSKKEQAALMVANSRLARQKLESELSLLHSDMKILVEQMRWYPKAFEYALRGGSHPGNPTWGIEI